MDEPPTVGAAYAALAPQVDSDGNDIDGLRNTNTQVPFSVGFDHIDIAAAIARGIVVTNTPEVLSFATAECAFALILIAARRAGEGERMVGAGKWKG